MRLGIAFRGKDERLFGGGEARRFYDDAVLTQRNIVEMKFASLIADGSLRPIGVGTAQDDLSFVYRTMLRIMDQAMDGTEDGGARAQRKSQHACKERDVS